MPNHKDVTGNDLHGSRVALTPANRAPLFAGELIFDPTTKTLMVGDSLTENGWERGVPNPPAIPQPPIAFHWAIDMSLTATFLFDSLALFYAGHTANVNASSSFSLLKRFTAGSDFEAGSSFDLTPWVQAKGRGYYMPLFSGPDGYGGSNQPISKLLRTTWINSSLGAAQQVSVAAITQVTSFRDDANRLYSGCNAVRCLRPFAHVNLELYQ